MKAVLFDLDNTLIDFMRMKRHASNAAARAMIKAGLAIDEKSAEDELFEFYLMDGIEGDTVFSHFIEKHNGGMNDRILAAGINAYRKAKQEYLKPYLSVPKVLNALKEKGLKIGIVTDAPRLKAYIRLDAMGIADIFDIVVGFEDTGKQKPHSMPFKKALEQIGFAPDDVLFVGDWIERDIVGAKMVGMKTCWAKYGAGDQTEKSNADYEIDDIKKLVAIIQCP